ncbi:hypothetical protein KC669_02220 [Candidatus Dojkabacteria bacterium]|uniref:Uncharacterized protein n=1 Tax=Candidatus Dojkabacteria bacterium TaxID=2099670 RepID=A0A955RL95_9BACT|nr:hypothetical protein [Candidatus Dojkabacteria bacterium]
MAVAHQSFEVPKNDSSDTSIDSSAKLTLLPKYQSDIAALREQIRLTRELIVNTDQIANTNEELAIGYVLHQVGSLYEQYDKEIILEDSEITKLSETIKLGDEGFIVNINKCDFIQAPDALSKVLHSMGIRETKSFGKAWKNIDASDKDQLEEEWYTPYQAVQEWVKSFFLELEDGMEGKMSFVILGGRVMAGSAVTFSTKDQYVGTVNSISNSIRKYLTLKNNVP